MKRVTDVIAEIVSASQEQASGIEQVNQSISEMDNVTQQNASLVEEAAAAAESLRDQAGNLVHTVSVFKLHAEEGRHNAPSLQTQVLKVASRTKEVTKTVASDADRTSDVTRLPRKSMPKAAAVADWEEF